MYGVIRDRLFVIEIFECVVKMDEDQWMYDSIMSEEIDMDDENEQECGVNEHVDCSDVFNTSQVIMFIIVIKLIKWMSLLKTKFVWVAL